MRITKSTFESREEGRFSVAQKKLLGPKTNFGLDLVMKALDVQSGDIVLKCHQGFSPGTIL